MSPVKENIHHGETKDVAHPFSPELESIIQEHTAKLRLTIEALRHENADLKDVVADQERMKEVLHKSEENLRAFMSALPQSAHLIDKDGTVIASNEVSPKRLGITLDEYIGTNIFTHLPPEIAAKRKEYFERVLREKTRVSWDDMRENRYYTHYAFPVFDESGTVSRVVHIALDVTERKQTEDSIHESEEKYRTLVELSPDAILIHQDGKIVYVNPAIANLLKTSTPEGLIGLDVFDLLHPDSHAVVQQNIKNDLEGMITPTTEIRIIRGDGTVATCEGRGKSIIYHRNPAIQVVLRDITERKKAELQLKEYTENLKRSNEDLELFASIASHDLQEPIRTIVTFTQLLLTGCSEGVCPSSEKHLQIIENAGLRMNFLVNDLRQYSGVRAHEKPLKPTDMENVLSRALDILRFVIKDTQTSITHDPLPTVLADDSQMIQVFQNLIDNAIKFRREGVTPKIQISASPLGDMWRFAIEDNGIGVPQEYFDKIFVLFERLHRRDAYPGTGLGLALCKRIIERHGGRIWVESEEGKGATFLFTLKA